MQPTEQSPLSRTGMNRINKGETMQITSIIGGLEAPSNC